MSGPTVNSWASVAARKNIPSAAQQAPATQQTSTSAPTSTTSATKDDAASTSTPSVTASVTESNEILKPDAQESGGNKMSDLKKALASATFADEVPTAPSAVAPRDDEASVAGSLATSTERNNKSSNSSARGHDDSTTRKPRKPKRSRNAEKEERDQAEKNKEAEPKAPLKDAAIPTVNFWHTRGAQGAKKLPSAATLEAGDNISMVNGHPSSSAPRTGEGAITETPDLNGSTQGSSKPPRQAETPRANGDQQLKRNAPRGGRVAEKDEKATVNGAVPSVEDAASWPTPATVTDDKKPKAASAKQPTEDDSNPKPAQKPAWSKFSYVPTAVFETPMPNIKGSKPRGAGRGTGGRGGHTATAGGQASDKTATGAVTCTTKVAEPRERGEAPGASAQGPTPAKRAPGDTLNGRDQRKSASPPNGHRSRELPVTEQTSKTDPAAQGARNEYVNGESATLPRNSVGRKSPEYSSSTGFTPSKDGFQPNREKGEGRGERGGRGGGYRRGGAHGGHPAQAHVSQSPYAFNNSRFPTNSTFSPVTGGPPFNSPPAQFGFGAPPTPKHGRGNTRSQSLSTAVPYGNQGAGPRNIPRMASLQTQGSPYYDQQYPMVDPPQYPMPAGPTYPTDGANSEQILAGIQQQVEYYFSRQNMEGDIFLKTNMDSQGFVPLQTIANFNRLKALVPYQAWLIWACANSANLDFVTSEHGVDLVRARDIWDKHVLANDARVEAARHHGPDLSRVQWRSFHALQAPAYFYGPPAPPMPPMYHTASPTAMGGYPPMMNGAEQPYPPSTNGVRVDTITNGNGPGHQGESHLSANVPDFSPSGTLGTSITMEEFQKISDADLEALHVKVTGSVINGALGSESEASSDGTSAQFLSYPNLREQALVERKQAEPGQTPMSTRQLYYYWATELPENFNISMYESFRKHAIEDAKFEKPRLFAIKQFISLLKALTEGKAESQYPAEFRQHRDEAEKVLQAAKPVINGSPHN